MKNHLHLLTLTASLFLICSFTNPEKPVFVGVYGVSNDDPSNIELTLKHDHSFVNHEVTSQGTIDVKGEWTLKGNKVHLETNDKVNFHRIWSFTNDGLKAKSRKGMSFYSLCRK